MDPNANLEELRALITKAQVRSRENRGLEISDVERLAYLFAALDGWLSKGGFLPKAWASTADRLLRGP